MTCENLRSGSAVVPRSPEQQRNRLSWENTDKLFNSLAGTAGWTRTTDLCWHSWVDSNHRPPDPQSENLIRSALTAPSLRNTQATLRCLQRCAATSPHSQGIRIVKIRSCGGLPDGNSRVTSKAAIVAMSFTMSQPMNRIRLGLGQKLSVRHVPNPLAAAGSTFADDPTEMKVGSKGRLPSIVRLS